MRVSRFPVLASAGLALFAVTHARAGQTEYEYTFAPSNGAVGYSAEILFLDPINPVTITPTGSFDIQPNNGNGVQGGGGAELPITITTYGTLAAIDRNASFVTTPIESGADKPRAESPP
jgi:hypothetical protein